MTNYHQYYYLGPRELLENLPENAGGVVIVSPDDITRWITATHQPHEYAGIVVATFIINTQGHLVINDRRSEHVLCAGGKNVLSAGEIFFQLGKESIQVVEITNQSTGYCPEPTSWQAVEHALSTVGIQYPNDFTVKFIFCLCKKCGTKNIVKDDWFECGVCQSPLSEDWNF